MEIIPRYYQADAGTSTTALVDALANFDTENVAPGMLVQDTTNGDTYEVVSVTDGQNLVIVQIYGTGGAFANLDNYTINETIIAYTTSDNIYDLILDTDGNTKIINDRDAGVADNEFGFEFLDINRVLWSTTTVDFDMNASGTGLSLINVTDVLLSGRLKVDKGADIVSPAGGIMTLGGDGNVFDVTGTNTTGSYCIRERAMRFFVKYIDRYAKEVDMFYQEFMQPKLDCYCIVPHMTKQLDGYSDIQGENVTYKLN